MKKILLVHGWNYMNYSSTNCTDAWANRSEFVTKLSNHFIVVKFNLPGFCGEKDPPLPWNLDDFVLFLENKIKQEKPDFILGYSFGAAVVLKWKSKSKNIKIKTLLVSPAIIRKYSVKEVSNLKRILKLLFTEKFICLLREIYLSKIIKNPYFSNATKVMKETYRNIVSIDLRNDFINLENPTSLIYGENDSATPPDLIKESLKYCKAQHRLHLITNGGHDIANTNTNELISIILKEREVYNEL